MGRNSRPAPSCLGQKLADIRHYLDMTQEQMLAAVKPGEAAENRGLISQYELGKSAPDYQTLLRYARLAKVSTDELIDDKLKLNLGRNHKPIESTATANAEVADDENSAGESAGATLAASDSSSETADSHRKGGNYRVSNSAIGKEAADIEAPAETQEGADTSPTAEPGDQEAGIVAAVSTPVAAVAAGGSAAGATADTIAAGTEAATDDDATAVPRRMESFAVRVDSRLLDLIDDDYLDLMHLVPRSLRPKVNREDFFRVLIVSSIADYHDHGEDSCLVYHWRQMTQRIARRAAPNTPVTSESNCCSNTKVKSSYPNASKHRNSEK